MFRIILLIVIGIEFLFLAGGHLMNSFHANPSGDAAGKGLEKAFIDLLLFASLLFLLISALLAYYNKWLWLAVILAFIPMLFILHLITK